MLCSAIMPIMKAAVSKTTAESCGKTWKLNNKTWDSALFKFMTFLVARASTLLASFNNGLMIASFSSLPGDNQAGGDSLASIPLSSSVRRIPRPCGVPCPRNFGQLKNQINHMIHPCYDIEHIQLY